MKKAAREGAHDKELIRKGRTPTGSAAHIQTQAKRGA